MVYGRTFASSAQPELLSDNIIPLRKKEDSAKKAKEERQEIPCTNLCFMINRFVYEMGQ